MACALGKTGLTLQQDGADFLYRISVSGDPSNPPMYHTSYSSGCNSADTDDPIVVDYLALGADAQAVSDTPTHLAGSTSSSAGTDPATADTWSFDGAP